MRAQGEKAAALASSTRRKIMVGASLRMMGTPTIGMAVPSIVEFHNCTVGQNFPKGAQGLGMGSKACYGTF